MKVKLFRSTLYRHLLDDEFALAYLRDAFNDGHEEFERAIVDCYRARGLDKFE